MVSISLLAAGGSGVAWPILFGLVGTVCLCLAATPAQCGARTSCRSGTASPSGVRQSLYDAIAAGVIVRRHDGTIAHVNRAASEMVGIAPEDFTADAEDSLLAFCDKDSNPLPPSDWPSRRALRTGQPVHDEVIGVRSGHGAIRWLLVNVNLAPVSPGDQQVAVVTFVDVSAQQAATAELAQAEAKLQNMLRAAPVGFGVLEERRFLWANENLCRLFDCSQDDLLGHDTALLYESLDEFHRVGNTVYTQMKQDQVGSTEARLRRSDGTLFDGHVQVAMLTSDPSQKRVAVAIVDITGLKNAERELKESNLSLRRKNIALEEMTRQIRQERYDLADRIAFEVDRLLLPLVTRLERSLCPNEREYLRAFVDDLHGVLRPYSSGASGPLSALTSTEMRIATLIRRGLSAKEIARSENISPATVNTHRANIRKKLHLCGRRVNLAAHLRSLFETTSP